MESPPALCKLQSKLSFSYLQISNFSSFHLESSTAHTNGCAGEQPTDICEKKIIEKSADEPHAVELLLHRLLNLRLVGFPPGHDA